MIARNLKNGTKEGGGDFRCLISEVPIKSEYIKQCGQRGEMGQSLIAIIVSGKNGKQYVKPCEEHSAVAMSKEIRDEAEEFRQEHLSTKTPDRLTGGTCFSYGLTTWGKLFTDRQVIMLKTFSSLIDELRHQIEEDAIVAGFSDDITPLRNGGFGATAYSEAICLYLAFSVSRLADRGSSLSSWDVSRASIRNTFSRQAFVMTYDFAEANPFSSYTGSWESCVGWVSRAVAELPTREEGVEIQHDAQTVSYPEFAVVSTDPPYYDNIGYADLSDFFFVWMRHSIGSIFPDIFDFISTPKEEELVAIRSRHKDRESAENFFLKGMSRVIENMSKQISADYPITIYYAFKQSEINKEGVTSAGWAAFLQAVLDSGYAIVGTWPMRTEMANRMIAKGTNALASSVVLVCRRRDALGKFVSIGEFTQSLKEKLPSAITKLQEANIAPVDMRQSAIGAGMAIFSEDGVVHEAGSDNRMTAKSALGLINAELDAFLDELSGEYDDETKFAVEWFKQYRYNCGPFDVANSLCQARNLSVDAVKNAGIIESHGGNVKLLRRSELTKAWDSTGVRGTTWMCLQCAVLALDSGEVSAARFLSQVGSELAASVKELSYRMYNLIEAQKKDSQDGISYNALVSAWPDLMRMVKDVEDDEDHQHVLI